VGDYNGQTNAIEILTRSMSGQLALRRLVSKDILRPVR
jgi:hypothetical protein